MIFYKILGILGLTLIIIGTFMISKKDKIKLIYFILFVGGLCLAIYSFYINDLIFIILQIIYILIVSYRLIELRNKK